MHDRSSCKGNEEEKPSNRTNPIVLFLLRIRIHVICCVCCHDF